MTNKQLQKGGDGSQLVQVQNVILGIDEKRVREILEEQLPIALRDFTAEARATAGIRSENFNKSLLKKVVEESALTAFSDPSFLILLTEAQKRAASTERELDYDLLAELMVDRFKKGSNRIIRTGISRAVEVVDQISDDALLGLTVLYCATYYVPTSGDFTQGLKVLDGLFEKVIYDNLPTKSRWLDHLDILDAVRLSSFGGTKLLEDYWYDQFDGYLKKGIQENSENHNLAKEILSKAGLNPNCLIKNSFDEKYVKLEILDRSAIAKLNMKADSVNRLITTDERAALEKIYDLYDGNKMSKKDFILEMEKNPNIKKLRSWWNELSEYTIQITSVGKVLARSNVRRIDKNLPQID